MGKKSVRKQSSSGAQGAFRCPECGGSDIVTSEEEYRFPYGFGKEAVELKATVPVRKCNDCTFSYTDHAAESICHDAICEHLGVMKPSQVKALRRLCNMTQAEFADMTALGQATLSRWERGIVIQNQAYDNYLYLMGFSGNLDRIAKRKKLGTEEVLQAAGGKKPHFRKLNVTDDVVARRDSFRLHA